MGKQVWSEIGPRDGAMGRAFYLYGALSWQQFVSPQPVPYMRLFHPTRSG